MVEEVSRILGGSFLDPEGQQEEGRVIPSEATQLLQRGQFDLLEGNSFSVPDTRNNS